MLATSEARRFEPVAVKAYRLLERMIVMLELPPGTVTTEAAMIETLRLGRTPVREAIQRLAWEGLLEVRPRAGIAVAPLNAGDWPKIIEARRGVEVLLARSAARFITAGMAERFREAALRMQEAVIDGSVMTFLDADRELDEATATTAENPYAARLAGPLRTHSRRFWFRYRRENWLGHAAEQHVRVIRAILDGDQQEAGRETDALMRLIGSYADSVSRL